MYHLTDVSSFPFEDPCVMLLASGQAIYEALENSVSTYPALEGRFPQVSNITFTFDPALPPNHRIAEPSSITIGNEPIDLTRNYKLVTRDYMARGKDGFTSLLGKSSGGQCEELVNDETGILISILLRQYFMSLKTLGVWSKWGKSMNRHWEHIHESLHCVSPVVEAAPRSPEWERARSPILGSKSPAVGLKRTGTVKSRPEGKFLDDSDDEEFVEDDGLDERTLRVMRMVMNKWRRLAGIDSAKSCDSLREGEFHVEWTRAIAPKVEGRINIVGVAA